MKAIRVHFFTSLKNYCRQQSLVIWMCKKNFFDLKRPMEHKWKRKLSTEKKMCLPFFSDTLPYTQHSLLTSINFFFVCCILLFCESVQKMHLLSARSTTVDVIMRRAMQWGNIEPLAYRCKVRCGRSVHRHSLKFLLPSCSFCCRSRKKKSYKLCILHCRASERERIIELNHVLELRDIRRKTSFLCLRQCIFTLYNRIYMRDVFHARKLHFEFLIFSLLLQFCLFWLTMRPWCLDRHTLKIYYMHSLHSHSTSQSI